MNIPSPSIHNILHSYIDVLGAPVLAIYGIKENGGCECKKGKACGKNAGKHPNPTYCPNGVKSATLDKSKVDEWVAAGVTNFGIATGNPIPGGGYLVVLDVDPRNGGIDSLEELESTHGKLPEGPTQLTGGDGFHYLFKSETP